MTEIALTVFALTIFTAWLIAASLHKPIPTDAEEFDRLVRQGAIDRLRNRRVR